MNKAILLLKLLEEVINPEEKYIDDNKESTTTTSPHGKLSREAQNQLKSLASQEPAKHAAYKYSKDNYGPMNHYLRTGSEPYTSDNKTYITNLKSLTKQSTKNEFYTYRGIKPKLDSDSYAPEHSVKEGDIIHDKGFVSTSLKSGIAGNFGIQKYKKDGKTESSTGNLFRIHITPGTKGHYIAGHDRVRKDEREFVLHPGTKFRVGKTVTHPSGRKFTELHIHSQED